MISVAAGSIGRAVLELVVAHPGELDAEAIARTLYPPPRWEAPPATAGHAARSASYATWRAAHRQHQRSSCDRVSRLLGRLQERGLIETRGAPLLADWWPRAVRRHGAESALRGVMDEDTERGALASHLALIARVEKGPASTSALLGPSPSGATKRTYDDLVTWGVIVPPSFRWPTPAGVALVTASAAPTTSPEPESQASPLCALLQ